MADGFSSCRIPLLTAFRSLRAKACFAPVGADAREHFRDTFTLCWANGRIENKAAAALPRPMANGCGAVLGNVVYIAGGTDKPTPRMP